MDYESEYEKLSEEKSGNVFKAVQGVQRLKILEEPEETVFTDNKTGEETPQIKLKLDVNGEEMFWYVGKGKTMRSVYGQLIALGKYKGQLAGESITLSVTSSNNSDGKTVNSYSILEAVECLPKIEKPTTDEVVE